MKTKKEEVKDSSNKEETIPFEVIIPNTKGMLTVLNVIVNMVKGNDITPPVLKHIKIESINGKNYLYATNLQEFVTLDLTDVIFCNSNGSVLVPIGELIYILKTKKKKFIKITKTNLTNGIQVESSLLATLPVEEFPVEPHENWEALGEFHNFSTLLGKVVYAAGTYDTRYVLNGVFFDFEHQAMAATDGHRMAVLKNVLPKLNTTVIAPIEALKTIMKLRIEKCKLSQGQTRLLCQSGRLQFTTKVIEGNYPNYLNVIPKDTNGYFKINRKEFLEHLYSVMYVSRSRNHALKLTVKDGKIILHATDPDRGEASEMLHPLEHNGQDVETAFNGGYLKETIESINSEEITVSYHEENLRPFKITDIDEPDYVAVVMPMRP